MGTFGKFLASKDDKIAVVRDGAAEKKPVIACPFFFLQLMFVFSSDFLLVLFPTRKKRKNRRRTSGKQIPRGGGGEGGDGDQIQSYVSNLNSSLKRRLCTVNKFNMQCQQYLIGI